jgi:hypothetical protein
LKKGKHLAEEFSSFFGVKQTLSLLVAFSGSCCIAEKVRERTSGALDMTAEFTPRKPKVKPNYRRRLLRLPLRLPDLDHWQ